jgi:hypothetical protein
MLVERGHAQISDSDYDFPKTDDNGHFSDYYYMRKLLNGECVQRNWLVYSRKADVFSSAANIWLKSSR